MRSTVCIVEDDAEMRKVLARVVTSAGGEAEEFASAESFLVRSAAPKIGCLLLDVDLGGMNGLALLECLARERAGYPVFLITAAHDPAIATQARRFGATVVDKPFDARGLAQAIRTALRKT